ncbi:MAG: sialidase family protein [Acidobacteria bacterium]|nr:sialidase family protein [Acidobacteriota bacterium]
MNDYRVVFLLSLGLLLQGCAAEPEITHVDVFTSGQDGYHTYRIPAVETAPDGSLLVFTEARKYNRHDPGTHGNDIDLVYKRSTDGGKTWSEMSVLDDPGERWGSCNPVTLLDRTTNRVWLFHNRTRPDRSSASARVGTDDSQAWARYSQDNGLTWSDPMDLTGIARDIEQWGSSFFGPGGAVQNAKGRLIVPVAQTTGKGNDGKTYTPTTWTAFAIYSDDHGETWTRGQLASSSTSENQFVELADGNLLMDARQDEGPTRSIFLSSDGGQTWSPPRTGQVVPPIASGIERYSLVSAGSDRNRILWSGPKGPGRQTMVLRVSYDEGKTFGNERVISEDKAAYSDMTLLSDRSIGVIWERGGYAFITLSRFDLGFVE